MMKLILASQSPRRKMLIAQFKIPFRILTLHVDEAFSPSVSPQEIVQFLSKKKATTIYTHFQKSITPNEILISADTIVAFENEILNKPTSISHAVEMLTKLQGHTHSVFTGFTLKSHEKIFTGYEETKVTCNPMNEKEILYYVQTENPLDKAGGYGIQDNIFSCFVSRINGCYYNVMGLPISKIYQSLKLFTNGSIYY